MSYKNIKVYKRGRTQMVDTRDASLPIIDIQLRGISEHIQHAFIDKQHEIGLYAAKCIDATFTHLRQGGLEKAIEETVLTVMNDTINKVITEAVEDAVREYFEEGEGAKVLIQTVCRAVSQYADNR